jgi:hypothetical protein
VDTPVKGKTQVVRGSELKMRGERTFKVRERAFSALTKQYAVEFFDPFWTTSNNKVLGNVFSPRLPRLVPSPAEKLTITYDAVHRNASK